MTSPDTSPEKPRQDRQTASTGGKSLALLSLLLAALALAAASWLGWRDLSEDRAAHDAETTNQLASVRQLQREQQQALDNMEQRLGGDLASASSLNNAEQQLQQLAARIDELQQLQNRIDSNQARLDGIEFGGRGHQDRIEDLEQSVASISQLRQGNSRQMLRAEVEYLLWLANERLLLFSDVEAAQRALDLADRQLAAADDPSLLRVRQALQTEMAALDAVEVPDRLAINQRLRQLEDQSATWPIAEPGQNEEVTPQPDRSIWQRIKDAASGLVTVRRQGPDDAVLLSLEEIDSLRARVALELQAARLAALRGESSSFQASLAQVDEWLKRYFDAGDASVRSANRAVADMRGVELQPELPDISASLSLLQAQRPLPAQAQPEPQAELPADSAETAEQAPADAQANEAETPEQDRDPS